MVRAAMVLLMALAVGGAQAHGPAEWIQRGSYKNNAGELCCGERDCGEMISGKVAATPHGYRVDALFRIIMPDGKIIIDEVHETVPYSEATPSPDGVYWRCRWGGTRKCFFAPPGSS